MPELRFLLAIPLNVFLLACSPIAQAADAVRGKSLFVACAACHNTLDGAVGPRLAGVIGRAAGSRSDFRYSAAMRTSGIKWTEETMLKYLKDPQGLIPGNRMAFAGMPEEDVRDLVAYLAILPP